MKRILLTISFLLIFLLSGCASLTTTNKKSIIRTTSTTNSTVESKDTTKTTEKTVSPTSTASTITDSKTSPTTSVITTSINDTTTIIPQTETITSKEEATTTVITDETFIILDDRNKPKINGENATLNYNNYELSYSKVSESQSGHIVITKGGSITNTTPFKEIESIEIEYQILSPTITLSQPDYGFGKLYFVTDDYKISNPFSYNGVELKKERETISSIDGHYISFFTSNTIEIYSLSIDYIDGEYKEKDSSFTLNLIGTNDIHGQVNEDLSTSTAYASLDYMSGFISSKKKENKWNLILDQGDVYQGSIEQYLTNGKIMDDYLLINGYSSTILGNHEWDYGVEKIIEYSSYSEVPLLACNVRDKNGNSPSWCKPYLLTEIHGVKIGLIGAIGDCKSSISYSMVKDFDFLIGSDLTLELKRCSNALKNMGAEFIILQFHYGTNPAPSDGVSYLDDYDVEELSSKYINLVLEGHTENNYAFLDSKGVYHIQTSGHLKSVFDLKIDVTSNGNGSHSFSVGVPKFTYANTIMNSYSRDNLMNEINNWYDTNVYGLKTRSIATTNASYMSSTTLKNKMALLYYGLYKLVPGYDIVYGGGYLSTRSPGTISAGTVTYGDIASIFPFDNSIYLCSITGANLLKRFINSGNSNYYGYLSISESDIVSNRTYYIITDSYNTDYQNKNSNVLNIIYDFTSEYNVYARDLLFNSLSGKEIGTKEKLETPILTQKGLVVSWNDLYGAREYLVSVNSIEYAVKSNSITLKAGDIIKVKAIGDNEYYLDSEWSNILTVADIMEEKMVLTSDEITYKDFSIGDTSINVRLLDKDDDTYSGKYLTIKTSPIIDKSSYSEFGIGSNGFIDIKSISGFKIASLTVKIYGTYDNFTFYDSNGMEIEPIKELNQTKKYIIYEIAGDYDEIIIRNETDYTVSVYYFTFDLIEK